MELQINSIQVRGTLVAYEYSHTFRDMKYYKGTLITTRLSGVEDVLPIIFREDKLSYAQAHVGKKISLIGDIRTINVKSESSRSSLFVYIQTSFIPVESEVEEDFNNVVLDGVVCKVPNSRTTARNFHVTDFILAVGGRQGRSYYIPIVAFFEQSLTAKELLVGDKIHVIGRFQSRVYKTRVDENEEQRLAYEVAAIEINKKENS